MDYAKIRELGNTVPKLVNLTCKVPKSEYDKIFRISSNARMGMGDTVRALVLFALQVLEADGGAPSGEEVTGDV